MFGRKGDNGVTFGSPAGYDGAPSVIILGANPNQKKSHFLRRTFMVGVVAAAALVAGNYYLNDGETPDVNAVIDTVSGELEALTQGSIIDNVLNRFSGDNTLGSGPVASNESGSQEDSKNKSGVDAALEAAGLDLQAQAQGGGSQSDWRLPTQLERATPEDIRIRTEEIVAELVSDRFGWQLASDELGPVQVPLFGLQRCMSTALAVGERYYDSSNILDPSAEASTQEMFSGVSKYNVAVMLAIALAWSGGNPYAGMVPNEETGILEANPNDRVGLYGLPAGAIEKARDEAVRVVLNSDPDTLRAELRARPRAEDKTEEEIEEEIAVAVASYIEVENIISATVAMLPVVAENTAEAIAGSSEINREAIIEGLDEGSERADSALAVGVAPEAIRTIFANMYAGAERVPQDFDPEYRAALAIQILADFINDPGALAAAGLPDHFTDTMCVPAAPAQPPETAEPELTAAES
jgi:hypothetical protein